MYKSPAIALIIALCLFIHDTAGQGVSSGRITGRIVSQSGQPLSEANVVAVHKPSGTEYTAVSRRNGTYSFPSVRVGGPYQLKATYVGYQPRTVDSFRIQIGQTRNIKLTLAEEASELEEVTISERRSVLDNQEPGISTAISEKELETLPTLNRSIRDFTRFTPQKGSGLSFAGRNNYYNNLTVDGSLLNNSFGLSPLPGGATNAQPLSLDAVKGIQVDLSPYDVTQSGFTGAGINLATRRGTNQVKGSVYSYFQRDDLTGSKVDGTNVDQQDFSREQYGFRVGGPIVKDKLFFFVNGEVTRRTQPASQFRANRPDNQGDNIASVDASTLRSIQRFLRNEYDYDPGRFEGFNYNTENEKVLLRLDWNINESNKLSFRYNSLFSRRDRPYFDAVSGDQNTLPFENSAYEQFSNLHSGIIEWNSDISQTFSNNLRIGATALRDFREVKGRPFPAVQIGSSLANATTVFGTDPFSGKNAVDQNILQLTDNLKIYSGNHTFTLGTSLRMFDFDNLFVDYFYGRYRYPDTEAFFNSAQNDSANGAYLMKYSTDPGNPAPATEIRTVQAGFYAQDVWQPSSQLRVTGGLRVDVPFYPIDIPGNDAVASKALKNDRQIQVGKLPDPQIHWSPRLGFNYQFGSRQQFQLSGGSGIFTGRPRFVWLNNQAGNTGTQFGTVFGDRAFRPSRDPYLPDDRTAASVPEINKTANNFHFPQVWRSSLGFDYRLPFGDVVFSGQAIYGEDVNAVVHRNINLREPSQQLSGADNRAIFDPDNRKVNEDVGPVYRMSNTDKGHQLNLTASLQKAPEDGFGGRLSYTYGRSRDITSNPNSIASFAFGRNAVVGDPNDLSESFSQYDTRHRIIGNLSYGLEYSNNFKTTISVVYNGQSGRRFSYVYSGDVNRDGLFQNNDLIYVPEDRSEINLTAENRSSQEVWNDLDNFIEKSDYLSNRRGQYAERNGAQVPWYNQFDLRVLQDFYLRDGAGNRHKLQASLDIINVGNLINNSWGVRKTPSTDAPIQLVEINDNNEPVYTVPEDLGDPFRNDLGRLSRWRMQLGIRYFFN